MKAQLDDILSGQAGQAGLQTLVKGRASRRQVRGALGQLMEGDYQLGSLDLTRVKYKPGRKLSAYYRAPVRCENILFRTVPIAVIWRPGSDGEVPSEAPAMEAEIRQRGMAAPFRRLFADQHADGRQLWVWPLDPRFPQLALLADPGYFALMHASNRETGRAAGAGRSWSIEPVRYRPGERHVLCYRPHQAGPEQVVYAKLYEESQAAGRAFRVATRIVDWLDREGGGVSGARPLDWNAEDKVVFYPHVSGVQLSSLLKRPGSRVRAALEKAGRALFAMHSGPASLGDELEERPLAQEVKAVRRACAHILTLLPETGAQVEALLDRVLALAGQLPAEPPAFTHSDFKADHLFVDGQKVMIIDFDTCALADPALDLGKFCADLEWWFGLRGRSGVAQAQADFLGGYGQQAPSARLLRARLYQALILLKITARRARLDDPSWAQLTMRMVGRGQEIIDGLGELLGQ